MIERPAISSPPRLRALTIWQPWASLIVAGIKLVENRGWVPPLHLHGQWLAIHAGRTYDADAVEWIRERLTPDQAEEYLEAVPMGALVGVARLARVVSLQSQLEPAQERWFVGRYGWVFDRVVRFPRSIECKGRQGLWDVPPDLVTVARERWQEARAA